MMWLASLQGRIVTVAAALMAVWGWFKVHDYKVVQQERASVEKKSNENAAKAQAARRSADKLPADRLLDKWCRDCR